MKWEARQPVKEGDVRERSGFLFFPRKIRGHWRWLEFARWQQMYTAEMGHAWSWYYVWYDHAWID